jgi:hypothetical protein
MVDAATAIGDDGSYIVVTVTNPLARLVVETDPISWRFKAGTRAETIESISVPRTMIPVFAACRTRALKKQPYRDRPPAPRA